MTELNRNDHEKEFIFTDDHYAFLSELANRKTGIVLPSHKKNMVYGRLVRRLRALNLSSFSEYCDLLKSSGEEGEVIHLINAITTNLTRFFREEHHFTHLETVVKEMAGDKNNPKRLRIWSAGCSSGMEPYSVAMTLRSSIQDLDRWDARILATDIDSNILNTGAIGKYKSADVEELSPAYQKYLCATDDPQWISISEEIKKLIKFNRLNLLEEWPIKVQFDAIFCRNVVIYFDAVTKQKLFHRLKDVLRPGGFLYIGHSENIQGMNDHFEFLGRTIYRRIK